MAIANAERNSDLLKRLDHNSLEPQLFRGEAREAGALHFVPPDNRRNAAAVSFLTCSTRLQRMFKLVSNSHYLRDLAMREG
jgi:hypothetical protein